SSTMHRQSGMIVIVHPFLRKLLFARHKQNLQIQTDGQQPLETSQVPHPSQNRGPDEFIRWGEKVMGGILQK
ncbi:hypothetical protein AB4Y89_22740, partial [Terriglobus sp. 2YAB30_2]|uniref:hypothetical protein n=1 Tax=unclassified Terriglobus TaxID=2628988 RepID=UPI003F9C4FDA